jgi:hypothetical protein
MEYAAMADPTPETPAAPAPVESAAPAPAVESQESKPLGEGGEKALKAERDARKTAEKERTELAARLKEYEDRDKTEAERQADRLANLEKSNRELAAEKARYEAAITHGLSRDDLALLGPGDDIAERAALLAQRLGAVQPAPTRLPESPNAGREPVVSDLDSEYEVFRSSVFPNRK